MTLAFYSYPLTKTKGSIPLVSTPNPPSQQSLPLGAMELVAVLASCLEQASCLGLTIEKDFSSAILASIIQHLKYRINVESLGKGDFNTVFESAKKEVIKYEGKNAIPELDIQKYLQKYQDEEEKLQKCYPTEISDQPKFVNKKQNAKKPSKQQTEGNLEHIVVDSLQIKPRKKTKKQFKEKRKKELLDNCQTEQPSISESVVLGSDKLEKDPATQLTADEQSFIVNGLLASAQTVTTFLATGDHLRCQFCDFSTTNLKLTTEMRKHRLEAHNECQLCGGIFSTAVELRAHFKKYHRRNSDSFICGLGGCLYQEKQVNIPSIYIHIRTQHCSLEYTCKLCSSKFSKRVSLQRHINEMHKGEDTTRNVPCKYCGKLIRSVSGNMELHIFNVHSDRQFMRCSLCEFLTKNPKYLDRHRKLHGQNPLKCDQCDYITKVSNRLIQHKEKRHRKREMLICSVCSYKTQFKKHMNRHDDTHGDKTFICDKCDFKTKTLQALKTHKLYHEDPKYFCDVCEYRTCNSANLSTHKRVKHEIEKFDCDQCGKLFSYKRHLNRHQANHAGLKMPCSFCEKCYYRKDKLNEHLRHAHSISEEESFILTSELPEFPTEPTNSITYKNEDVERNFACNACPKKFTNSNHLSRHKNSIHSSEVLSCQYCQKNFSRKDKLNVHESFSCKYRN